MSSNSSSKSSSESEDNNPTETQKITKQKGRKKEKKKNKKNKKEVELVDKELPKEEGIEGHYRKIVAPSELIFEKKRGYEFIPKKPIQIEVAFQKYRVLSIDCEKSEFTCVFSLHLRWKDPNLDTSKFPEEIDWFSGWEPAWTPKIEFLNEVDEVERFRYNYHTDSSGCVRYYGRYRGTFYEPFQLHRFPFDRHYLQIRLSTIYPLSRQVYVKYENYPNTMETNTLAEWKIPSDALEVEIVNVPEGPFNFARCNLKCKVERYASYYLWNIVFSLFLIVMMSLGSLFFPPEELDSRLSVTLTLVLTSVAYKFVVTDNLPKISYQTWLDIYVLVAFFYIFLVAVENLLAYSLTYYYHKTQLFPLFDQVAFGLLGGTWILFHLILLVVRNTKWPRLRRRWNELKSPF